MSLSSKIRYLNLGVHVYAKNTYVAPACVPQAPTVDYVRPASLKTPTLDAETSVEPWSFRPVRVVYKWLFAARCAYSTSWYDRPLPDTASRCGEPLLSLFHEPWSVSASSSQPYYPCKRCGWATDDCCWRCLTAARSTRSRERSNSPVLLPRLQ